MPYVYRRLTPAERERALREPQARGFPLHAPPHPMRTGGRYLITAANFGHEQIMFSSERRTDFEALLLQSLQEIESAVFGWVVLPNHYHVLIGVNELDGVSSVIKGLHGKTAREWNLLDDLVGKRKVWYRFSDRKIRDEVHFNRALNYVHFNPVKHGYVDSVYDWPWSSVQNYVEARGREWLRDNWRHNRPDRMGRGWDD